MNHDVLFKRKFLSDAGVKINFICLAALFVLLCGNVGVCGDGPTVPAGSGRAELMDVPVFNGKIYFYDSAGTFDQTVLLLHGVGEEASDIWQGIVPLLEKHYRVIYFDLPGFGRSDKGEKDYTPEKYAALVKWIADRHVRGPVSVIGHSLGGAVALFYAGAYPDNLERIVAVDAAGILHRTALMRSLASAGLARQGENSLFRKQLEQLSDRVSSRLMTRSAMRSGGGDADPNDPGLLRGKMPDTPQTAASLALISTDFSPVVTRIHKPVRLIWGEKDATAPLRTGKMLAAMMPDASLQVIEGAGHSPMIDQPVDFYRAVLSALSETDAVIKDAPEKAFGNKSISLSSKRNLLLRGEFNRIEIHNCRNIRLQDITARRIKIVNSTVDMENFTVKTDQTAFTLVNSTVVLTAGTISAGVGISTAKSLLDLAGVRILSEKAAVKSPSASPSTAVFSVCLLQSLRHKGYFHDLVQITTENPL